MRNGKISIESLLKRGMDSIENEFHYGNELGTGYFGKVSEIKYEGEVVAAAKFVDLSRLDSREKSYTTSEVTVDNYFC